MGVGVVPFYEPQVPEEAQYNGDGKGLAEEFEALNEIAAEAGLRPLRDFAENEFEEYVGGKGLPQLTYHPIIDGLATIEGLVRAISLKPDIASKLSDPDYTLEELKELARSLRAAQPSGARFCLFFM
jgi:hypothetical protein